MDAALTDVELGRLAVLASSDPERARRLAIARAAKAADGERIALFSIAAEASIRVGTISDALALFRHAADLADRLTDARGGPLRVRVAAMLAASGESGLALQALDEVEPSLGASAWLAWYQRGLILHWSGRSEEGLVWFDRAAPGALAAGDDLTLAKLVMNRAIANAHVGHFEAASADAADAEQRCRNLGELTLAAHALHNRGWITARSGDLAEGWRQMHDAAADPSWTAPPTVLADRAELAHAAGLLSEAADLADEAADAQQAVGDHHGSASTTLLRARIALDLDDTSTALRLAASASAALVEQGRLSLCGAAAGIEIAARRVLIDKLGAGQRGDAARTAFDDLAAARASVERHAWPTVRLDGLIDAGQIAQLGGRADEAERLFHRAEHDRSDGARRDVQHHVAAALRRGVRTGVVDTGPLESAWHEHRRRRATRSGYELNGDWGASTRLLTRVALAPLLERGDAETAILWLERLRRLASPTNDNSMLHTTAALRDVWARRRSGAESPDLDVALLDDQESALEAELVGRARLSSSTELDDDPPDAGQLAAELAGTHLRWIIVLPAGAWTVELTRDTAHVATLDRHRLRQDAMRLASAMRLGDDDWLSAASDLDATLHLRPESSQVVVIPVGTAVEDVSFGALPSLQPSRLRICWSGAHWLSTRARRHVDRVTIAATGIEESNREVELLGGIWPTPTLLRGADVTSANILGALATDDLVHVGAHGHLRRDNPMLSMLECADGPLYGYELTKSPRVAGTVLLWSCALGGARMPADVGVAGWPTLLSQLGCNALIAAPGALPSAPATDLAVEVHRGLARGDHTDAVLRDVRLLEPADDLVSRAAAQLAVYGAG